MFYLLFFLQFVSGVSPSVLSYSCPGYISVAVDTAKSGKGIVCILDCLSEDLDYSGLFTLGSFGFLPGLSGPWTLDLLGPWTFGLAWIFLDLLILDSLLNLQIYIVVCHVSIFLSTL